jgi:hypothetical protein
MECGDLSPLWELKAATTRRWKFGDLAERFSLECGDLSPLWDLGMTDANCFSVANLRKF